MKIFQKFILGSSLLILQTAFAHGPVPVPLIGAPIPPVPGLLDGTSPIVVNKDMAIALGKALFWDMNVGSDGMSCGSCHFHAGADARVKNQINPGEKSIHQSPPNQSGKEFDVLLSGSGGPNHTLTLADFPLHQFSDPLHNGSDPGFPSTVTFTTDDVVSSAGTFSGEFKGVTQFTGSNDTCERSADPIFHVSMNTPDGTGTRRVEPRNAPTVINVAFNHRNFWDGRANNIFNGSSTWGERDPNAGIWVKTGARSVEKQRLHLENSSLASLAMGPPLNPSEMSCRGRNLAVLGRKLLMRKPLQNQKVHYEDSHFTKVPNLVLSTASELKPGLNTTYKAMITKAFNSKYWSYSALGPFGAPSGQIPYNQVEANFSLFFGIALQMYQSTLVSDQAPIDVTKRNGATYLPTWEGLGKTPEEIAHLNNGLALFENNHCNLCHAGPTMSNAAITTNAMLVTPTPGKTYGPDYSLRAYGPAAMGVSGTAGAAGISQYGTIVTRDSTFGGNKLEDFGFANTGVGDPVADPGVAGVDDFGNPLSFSAQYVNYLLGNTAGVFDPGINKVRTCDFLYNFAIDNNSVSSVIFTNNDGIEPDGTREGSPRNQNCLKPVTWAYIPTTAAALASQTSAPKKLAVANQAAFKVPSLRNVELTGPFMHNGSMKSLEEVIEFYARFGNFENPNRNSLLPSIGLADSTPEDRADLVAFLKTFTDDRVRYEKAPFDHPEIIVPHGHEGNDLSVTAGNPISPALAKDEVLVVPAVGANGRSDPLLPFDEQLAP